MFNAIKMILLAGLCAIAISSQAALLTAGNTVATPGTTVAAQPELAGTVILDELLTDTVFTSDNNVAFLGAQIQNRVVRSRDTGQLIFMPRFVMPFNITLFDYVVDSIEIFGFSDFTLDVNYRTDGLGDKGPQQASRSLDGETIRLDYFSPLFVGNLVGEPQQESLFHSIYSDATEFSLDGRLLVNLRHFSDPGQSYTLSYANIAVPTRSVSAPQIFFFSTALGLLLLWRKRRAFNAIHAPSS